LRKIRIKPFREKSVWSSLLSSVSVENLKNQSS
jgi:hypothetical protein